jgi:hypothetical protein
MDMKSRTKRGVGRPPRRDDPMRIAILLPGELRRWLRIRAAVELRTQGDVIAVALELYREHVDGKKASRR